MVEEPSRDPLRNTKVGRITKMPSFEDTMLIEKEPADPKFRSTISVYYISKIIYAIIFY